MAWNSQKLCGNNRGSSNSTSFYRPAEDSQPFCADFHAFSPPPKVGSSDDTATATTHEVPACLHPATKEHQNIVTGPLNSKSKEGLWKLVLDRSPALWTYDKTLIAFFNWVCPDVSPFFFVLLEVFRLETSTNPIQTYMEIGNQRCVVSRQCEG